jgi:hypothetical protein
MAKPWNGLTEDGAIPMQTLSRLTVGFGGVHPAIRDSQGFTVALSELW